jgi:hypothetical protein
MVHERPLPGTVPADLPQHFRYFAAAKAGDNRRFHLYCDFREADQAETPGQYHSEWNISGTMEAKVSDVAAFVERLRAENELLFVDSIVAQLTRENAYLVYRDGRLVRLHLDVGSPAA